jgi:hypothetical protein
MRTDRFFVLALVGAGSLLGSAGCGDSRAITSDAGEQVQSQNRARKDGAPLANAPRLQDLLGEWRAADPTGTQQWRFLASGKFESNTDLGNGSFTLSGFDLTLTVWRESERAFTRYTYSLYVSDDTLIFPAVLRSQGQVGLIGQWASTSRIESIVQDVTEQRAYSFESDERFTETISQMDGNPVSNDGVYRQLQGDRFLLNGTRGELQVRALDGLAFGAAPASEYKRR